MNSNLLSASEADILLVDDNLQSLRLLRTMLREQGYRVRATVSGVLALKAIEMMPPDLVLLDINMPEMNGYEVCQKLKSQEHTAEIPVIFLSALDEVLDKVKAFDVGGVDYISKPYKNQEVLIRVKNQITLSWQQKKLIEQQKQLAEQNVQLQLLLATTKAINEASDFQSALEATLCQVCEKIGWDFGEFWVPNADASILEYGKGWYASNKRFAEFRHKSETFTLAPNIGIPGRVWSSKQPQWLVDVSAESHHALLRSQLALEVGLKASLGVPILFNDEVLAILVFFKREATEPEPRLMELVNALATQLSSLIQRKRAEQATARLTTILEATPDIVSITNVAGHKLYLNRAARQIYGIDGDKDITNLRLSDFHPPDVADFILNQAMPTAIANGVWSGKTVWRRGDGEVFPVSQVIIAHKSDKGDVEYISTIARDISDVYDELRLRKQAELALREKAQQLEQALTQLQHTQTQLVQNEKMVSLGQLVAGVAHEINNPTNFIYGNINLAREHVQDLLHLLELYQQYYPQPVKEITEQLEHIDPDFIAEDFPKLLASMQEGANRITEIVQCLRNFSRLDEAERKQVDIHEGIDSTLLILQHRLKSQSKHPEIQVNKEYGQLPLVECYPSQLNQVFMNILNNAIDALEERMQPLANACINEEINPLHPSSFIFHPSIWIRTSVFTDSSPKNESNASEALDSRVVICIANNGSGLAADAQLRIFDPFFTTKPPGKGTGLGLSISYRIVVERHGGQIRCHSVLGQGAEFIIELPIAQETTSVNCLPDSMPMKLKSNG